ncbi:unnamed protein product [Albugo candida]|uniref:Uncharacterized protein n=1 Tax=Albugo candida TaxID=65357 RepID=A0A024FVW3_9STRA|nr:unnamed protein product [Albugo candida]|eukprot:CCI10804.1 unnamed protein product [Albugo candida]
MSNGEFPGIVIVIGFRSTKRIIEGMKSTIMYRVAVSEKNRFWDTQSLVASNQILVSRSMTYVWCAYDVTHFLEEMVKKRTTRRDHSIRLSAKCRNASSHATLESLYASTLTNISHGAFVYHNLSLLGTSEIVFRGRKSSFTSNNTGNSHSSDFDDL